MNKMLMIAAAGFWLGSFTLAATAADDDVNQNPPEVPDTRSLQPGELPPVEYFDRIIERPLFDASRRPRPDEEGDDSPVLGGDLKEKWRLAGVVEHDGELLALFAERSGDGHMKLSVGMPLDQSGELTEIGPDFALIDNGEDQIRFDLWEPRQLPPEPRQPARLLRPNAENTGRDSAGQPTATETSRNSSTEEKD